MSVDQIKSNEHKQNTWSGGTTTQLYIWPPGADYAKRDFLFRISTATVETETSVFTSLPGFKRILMILQGELLIKHKGHHEKKLTRFEQDFFDGSWETSAEGKVTDFNLMMAEGVGGSVIVLRIRKGERYMIETANSTFIYLFEGSVKVGTKDVNKGDLIAVINENGIEAEALVDTQLILCKVNSGI